VEVWQQIRRLAAQGESQRSIAASLGLSRNTVGAALKRDGAPRYARQQEVAPEPWQEAAATGARRGLRGSRLLADARRRGYCESRATFYRWLAAHKTEHREVDAACRFETDPGEQAQFDWAEYAVMLGGISTKVYVYGLLLGYSRRVHWFPSLALRQDAVFEGLEAGLRHFGGACRFLLIDNAKAFVTSHRGSEVQWNRNFLRLCGHYSVEPIAGTPVHPQGKGKVENPFGHLEELFVKGTEWRDFDHFQAELAAFEEQWEQRVHGTTKIAPAVRFEQERQALLPLPVSPFLQMVETFRIVSNDCLISFDGVKYSVPWPYASKQVLVRQSQGRDLVVYSTSGEQLARHALRPSGTPPVILPQHYEGLRRRHLAAVHTLADRFQKRYSVASGTAETFLQRLLAQHRHRPERPLSQALELLSTVPDATALAALADAVEFNLCTPRFLEELLRRRTAQAPPRAGAAQSSARIATQLPLPNLDVERALDGYGLALPDTEKATQKGEAK